MSDLELFAGKRMPRLVQLRGSRGYLVLTEVEIEGRARRRLRSPVQLRDTVKVGRLRFESRVEGARLF